MDNVKAPPASFELHISELLLDETAPAERHRVRDSVGQELTRLLIEQGIPSTCSSAAEVRLLQGVLPLAYANETVELRGVRLAHAIYSAIRR
jgi:hypothetical protein